MTKLYTQHDMVDMMKKGTYHIDAFITTPAKPKEQIEFDDQAWCCECYSDFDAKSGVLNANNSLVCSADCL